MHQQLDSSSRSMVAGISSSSARFGDERAFNELAKPRRL